MSEWYYVEGGERRGPVAAETLTEHLRSGALPPDTLVWRDGMSDWAPATQFAEFTGGSAAYAQPLEPGMPAGGYDPYAQDDVGVEYVTYAGFWKRFVAWFIDRIILAFVGGCFGGIVGGFFGAFAGASGANLEDPNMDAMFQLIGFLVGTIVSWLYFALFESSQYQATPGKMVLQIKVTDLAGNRISFARATGRHFAKILSGLILMIGYIMAGFTEKKQALHDMLAGCLVINR